jgi:hypothetical protein
LSLPNEIAPGLVEVIILHEKIAKPVKKRIRRKSHPAFGMWAGRKDVNSSAEFAATLRQQVEGRTNGHD